MMRMLLVVALLLVAFSIPDFTRSPHAAAEPHSSEPHSSEPHSAEPYNCPPACDRIPVSAWIPQWAIPLNSRYVWPQLAAVAVTSASPRFQFEELCSTAAVAKDPRSYAIAERAVVANPAGQWQLQAQIVHWRGETWRGGQLAESVFDTAVAALRDCQHNNPATSPSITVNEPGRMAAVVSGPVVLHQYLVANPDNSTVTELAMWSTAPPLTPWPTTSDAAILDALNAPLCTAYIGSCP